MSICVKSSTNHCVLALFMSEIIYYILYIIMKISTSINQYPCIVQLYLLINDNTRRRLWVENRVTVHTTIDISRVTVQCLLQIHDWFQSVIMILNKLTFIVINFVIILFPHVIISYRQY